MDFVVRLPQKQRNELFSETAARKGMAPAVAEKDFWVTWTLGKIFNHPELRPILRFKGGTSLSKVYQLIERFSEDIDLILDWTLLTEQDPNAERSKKRQKALIEKMRAERNVYLREQFLPILSEALAGVCRCDIADRTPNIVKISYPNAFPSGYLRPEILLEIGPIASWLPFEEKSITPYAAEVFPELFKKASCPVFVIKAERTFWEKVTILHHEANRPESSSQPPRLSRHYYDVAQMAAREVKVRALADLAMLEEVVKFKMRFFPRGWAKYEIAKAGTLRLIPQGQVLESVRADYKAMREMIYGDYPDFEEIQKILEALEAEINAL